VLDLDPVGPQQPQADRQTRYRFGLVIAHQCHQFHGFARPIDAAIGVEKRIDRTGLRPAADAAVAQIEGGAADLEKVEVVFRAIRSHDERFIATAAAQ